MQHRSSRHCAQAAEQSETTVAISHRWPGRAHCSRGAASGAGCHRGPAPRTTSVKRPRAASARMISIAALSSVVRPRNAGTSLPVYGLHLAFQDCHPISKLLEPILEIPEMLAHRLGLPFHPILNVQKPDLGTCPEGIHIIPGIRSSIAAEPEALTCTSNPAMSQAEAASNEEQDAGARKSFNDRFLSATIPSWGPHRHPLHHIISRTSRGDST